MKAWEKGALHPPTIDTQQNGGAMQANVVMHLDWDQVDALKMGLENIRNLLKEIPPDQTDVRFVMNGKAVVLFRKDRIGELQELVEELRAKGVRFCLCRNALAKNGINGEDLIDGVEIVPAGIVELIRLQQEGFAYVKP
jgi:hypothetical protein